MNCKEKELIIFDFDGTLINSIPDLAQAINNMLAHYNLPQLQTDVIAAFVGNGAQPLVKRSLEEAMQKEVETDHLKEAFAVYFDAYDQITCDKTFLYPHVKSTLAYLHQQGYKMVICTNKPFRFIAPILAKLDIEKYFEMWIGEDSLPEKKPKATPLLHLAKEMNTGKEKTVMIGDSKNDILAAHNAGMDSIGLTYGYNYNEHIADYNPSLVVDDFSQLKTLF